jgi:hypothetical protein
MISKKILSNKQGTLIAESDLPAMTSRCGKKRSHSGFRSGRGSHDDFTGFTSVFPNVRKASGSYEVNRRAFSVDE